jgi:hypothetical protein
MTVAVRAAGSVQECIQTCKKILASGPYYIPCAEYCGRRSMTDELEGFSIPSIYSSAPAQPINPGQFTTFFHLTLLLIKSVN